MKSEIKSLLKRVLPEKEIQIIRFAYRPVSHIRFKLTLRQVRRNHKKEIERVRNKDRIKVVFFLIEASVWKVDGVFRHMLESKRFDPVVVICPYVKYGHDVMIETIDRAEEFAKSKGYPYVRSYNEKYDSWLDVKKELKPDLVFFTNPYKLTRKEYLINNFLDTLTCNIHYSFKVSNLYNGHFNTPTQNFCWKYFLETNIHKQLANQYARNKGLNTVVTGYPGMDEILKSKSSATDIWKNQTTQKKRIIWAPHHTIPGYGASLDYSTFLTYHNLMLLLADKYKEFIQFAFKPHPILKSKLSLPEVWGIEATNKYYEKWANLENGQVNDSAYIDLFQSSDALIHDSGSFLVEYLYTGKPAMFLLNDLSVKENFNKAGKMALESLYIGRNIKDIESFLEEVVLQNIDYKKQHRINYFETTIKPPNNTDASINIYNYIYSALQKDKS